MTIKAVQSWRSDRQRNRRKGEKESQNKTHTLHEASHNESLTVCCEKTIWRMCVLFSVISALMVDLSSSFCQHLLVDYFQNIRYCIYLFNFPFKLHADDDSNGYCLDIFYKPNERIVLSK